MVVAARGGSAPGGQGEDEDGLGGSPPGSSGDHLNDQEEPEGSGEVAGTAQPEVKAEGASSSSSGILSY